MNLRFVLAFVAISQRRLQLNAFHQLATLPIRNQHMDPVGGRRRHLNAQPKRGSIVDSYQTISVNCSKCRLRLFRYKKKNGRKSALVKCYIERIVQDSADILRDQVVTDNDNDNNGAIKEYSCPGCGTRFARAATVKGLPALKMVGGKVLMAKK